MPAKSRTVKRVVHRRYSDKRGRADLKSLALCNNINGPLPGARLTGKDDEVTCGRCKRIMSPDRTTPVSRPFSNADMRRMALESAPGASMTKDGALSGAEDEVLTEAHDDAAAFLLATPIGKLGVDEAFGSTFTVTPFLAWDKGEVSGPYDNWGRVQLTVEHLVLAIESLNDLQRAVFYTEIWRRRHEKEGG